MYFELNTVSKMVFNKYAYSRCSFLEFEHLKQLLLGYALWLLNIIIQQVIKRENRKNKVHITNTFSLYINSKGVFMEWDWLLCL